MSKLVNTLFYSFFRTLGRILAYLGIGALIGFILARMGVL